MIDDATIKRVAEETGAVYDAGSCSFGFYCGEDMRKFARAIEQLTKQEQREEDARICEKEAAFLKSDNNGASSACEICAEAIRASGEENSNERP